MCAAHSGAWAAYWRSQKPSQRCRIAAGDRQRKSVEKKLYFFMKMYKLVGLQFCRSGCGFLRLVQMERCRECIEISNIFYRF